MTNIIKSVPFTTFTLDDNLRIINSDNSFEKITGYNKGEIKKSNIYLIDLFPIHDKNFYFDEFNKLTTGEKLFEHCLKTKDGNIIFVYSLIITSPNSYKTIKMFTINNSLFLSNKEKELEEKYKDKIKYLENIAIYDDLTGLLRREPFIKSINSYLEKKVPISFFIIDIDKFKSVNDNYGHTVGDEILIKVADIFKEVIKENGLICRLGGDEFAILIPEVKNMEENKIIAKSILNKVTKIHIEDLKDFKTSVSIGGILINNYKKIINFNYLYSTADKELYKAKQGGKNRYSIYS